MFDSLLDWIVEALIPWRRIAWDVPLTGTWGRHVWSGAWSEQARRWVAL